MGVIRLKTDDLNRRRRMIGRMLRPLHAGQFVPCDMTHSKSGNGIVLAAHSGHGTDRDYRNWRFRSKAKDVWCQYFEVWSDADSRIQLSLVCAYLTLFLINRVNQKFEELLCIHCDPDDQSDTKRGPHLHVMKAVNPLPKCHFALNYSHLNDVLESIQTLDRAMCKAIAIVAKEVIPRFPANA